MPAIKHQITPCLWFDTQAEEAAKFYVSIFENSRIKQISRYGKVGRETHGKEAGSVLTVEFELNGQTFVALNGGPQFKFNEVGLVPGDVRIRRTRSIISGTGFPTAAKRVLAAG